MEYELTVILDASAKKNAETLAALEKLIESAKGKLIQKDDWGLKRFAYPIKKQESGHYFYYRVELNEKAIKPLDRKLSLTNEVVRYLIVKAN